ncbi:MAG TPA: VCBS repeat-containing protein, partial [Polyangium sp.]|nr:VCBS repeat-containing protein [Polyangium sp.]
CCGNICNQTCVACSAAKKGQGTDGACGAIANTRDPDNECNPGECNGAGACNQSQTPQANGALCTLATQCQSGFCVDGYCCDTACTGTCNACASGKKFQGWDGQCGPIKYDQDPDNECYAGACSGTGTCQSYNSVACTQNSQCLSGFCADGVCCGNLCNQTCYACTAAKKGSGQDGVCGAIASNTDPDNECGLTCNGAGACVKAPNGTACASAAECVSNFCVDGVCCDNACTGACQACTVAKKGSGSDGTCGNIAANTDPDNECATNCNGAGACVILQAPNGAYCSSNSNCLSGFCVDGVCCNSACSGSCQACNMPGTEGKCASSCTSACSSGKVALGGQGPIGPLATLPDLTRGLAVSDLNGDGIRDIIVTQGNNVRVFLRQSNGTLNAGGDYAAGTVAAVVVAGDFNADSKPDLAVLNADSHDVSVLLNQGNGTFATKVDYGTQLYFTVVAADLNGDGKLDLVTGGGSGGVAVMLNQGNGTFGAAVSYTQPQAPYSIALADVSGDGVIDIVTMNIYGFGVYRGQGNGTFAAFVEVVNTGSRPVGSLVATDLNGDAVADVAITFSQETNASVYLAQGNLTFAAAATYGLCSVGSTLVAADVTGDAKADLVVSGASNLITAFRNLGNGAMTGIGCYPAGSGNSSLAAGDMNGDGRTDMVTGGEASFNVLTNQGGGVFGTAPNAPAYATGTAPKKIWTADVNGDGNADLVTSNDSNSVSVLLGQGNGSFAAKVDYASGQMLTMADINGDARPDIVDLGTAAYDIGVLLNQGNGTFATRAVISGTRGYSVVAAELNGDGFADLAYVTYKSAWQSINGMWYPSENFVKVRWNQGNGTFGPEIVYDMGGISSSTWPVTAGFGAMGAKDLNGDGRADLVVGLFERNNVHVRLHDNTSTVNFTSYGYPGLDTMVDVSLTDHSGDGIPDIAFNDYYHTTSIIGLDLGNGLGGFPTSMMFPWNASSRPPFLAANGELHGDGVMDVIAPVGTAINVSSGIQYTGFYAASSSFATTTSPSAVVSADFNNDGRPDVATANTSTNNVTILLNTCLP